MHPNPLERPGACQVLEKAQQLLSRTQMDNKACNSLIYIPESNDPSELKQYIAHLQTELRSAQFRIQHLQSESILH